MSCERTEERIHDYVDGELPEDVRREMERHVAGCARCAEEVEALRELQARVADLPREMRPPRDLWPGIEERIGGASSARDADRSPRGTADRTSGRSATARPSAAERERPFWTRPWQLAAAALILVVLSSGITALLLPSGRTVVSLPGATVPAAEGTAPSRVRDAELEYLHAVEGLLLELDRQRDEIAPETLMVVEKNLEIIDEAIRRTRTALEVDPDNRELARLLSSAYERKVEMLRRAGAGTGL